MAAARNGSWVDLAAAACDWGRVNSPDPEFINNLKIHQPARLAALLAFLSLLGMHNGAGAQGHN